jgi:hypothetical protein
MITTWPRNSLSVTVSPSKLARVKSGAIPESRCPLLTLINPQPSKPNKPRTKAYDKNVPSPEIQDPLLVASLIGSVVRSAMVYSLITAV